MHSNPHHNQIDELEKWYAHAKEVMDFWPIAYYPFHMRMTEQGLAMEDIYDSLIVKADWDKVREVTEKANAEGFPMFMGYEWQGNGSDGDHNVFFLDNNQPQNHPMTYKELYESYQGVNAIGIPHHIAYQLGSRGKNWETHNEKFSPFAEIYSSHGCSENDEGPLKMERHIHMGPRTGNTCYEWGLNKGYIVGCIASGDNHVVPGTYNNGMMCALAKSNSKKDIWDALINRRVYGVSASRIDVDFTMSGEPMGSCIKPGDQKVLQFDIKGTSAIDRVEVLKNNIVNHMYVHSGKWEKRDLPHIIKFKIKIEFGWGPDIRIYKDQIMHHWSASLRTAGRILSVEKCWNNYGQKITKQTEQTCDFKLITYQSTTTGKWMGQSNVANEGLIFEIEAPQDSSLLLSVNGETYQMPINELLKSSRIIPMWNEVKEFMESCWGKIEHYRNDSWWHNAYKVKISKAYPDVSYEIHEKYLVEAKENDQFRLRIYQKNGDVAWVSPIFIR